MIFSSFLANLMIGASLSFQVLEANKELPDQDIRLQVLEDGALQFVQSGKTNSRGEVVFNFKETTNNQARYIASTSFEGRQFFSKPISLLAPPQDFHRLQVYKTQASSEGLRIQNFQMSARYVDTQLVVEESFTILNPTNFLLTGTKTPEGAEVFRLPLPSHIFNWNRLYGLNDNFRVDGKELVVATPLAPGEHYFGYAYRIVAPKLSADVTRDFYLPIDSISISTNSPKIRLSLPFSLVEGPPKFYRQEWYQTYEAQMPQSWTGPLELKIKGLPLNVPFSWWLPFIGVLVFLSLAFSAQLGIKTELRRTSQSIEPLLQSLRDLDTLLDRKVIDRAEFRNRRLQILQKLVPLYLSRDKLSEDVGTQSA